MSVTFFDSLHSQANTKRFKSQASLSSLSTRATESSQTLRRLNSGKIVELRFLNGDSYTFSDIQNQNDLRVEAAGLLDRFAPEVILTCPKTGNVVDDDNFSTDSGPYAAIFQDVNYCPRMYVNAIQCHARASDVEGVQRALERGNDGWPKLIFDAFIEECKEWRNHNGSDDLTASFRILLHVGGQKLVHQEDFKRETLLFTAARLGVVPAVNLLIRAGADVDHINTVRRTSLQYSVLSGHLECVEILLDEEAAIDLCDNGGSTALLHAVGTKHLYIVEKLLKEGANVEHLNSRGDSPLLWAVQQSPVPLAMAQTLLKFRADTEVKNFCGETALFCAIKRGHIDLCRYLLEKCGNSKSLEKNIFGIDAIDLTPQKCLKELSELESSLRKVNMLLTDEDNTNEI